MLNNHAKLMQFFLKAKEVTGRKKLQKMVYILQSLGVPFEEKYQFHFYGPYSEELSLRIEELCNLGFVEEEKEEKSNYYQYHYKITNDGLEFLNQFALDMPNYKEQVVKLNGKSARFLELVSTMLYFNDFNRPEVEEKIQVVKPKQNYSEDEISEAWKFIDELNQGLLQ
ncbi:YwgA family protein [Ornithinibacillus salinisoli]|uniref:YwgA family protein n=1 Tax=Ornithinibacillus salinisoli TaxID=1848459 RepID=A0ABW4W149_9BACI